MKMQGNDHSSPVQWALNPDKIALRLLIFCGSCELLFLILDYHVNFGRGVSVVGIRELANLAREDSLSSWFAYTQTLLIGLTLWLTYLLVRRDAAPWSRRGWVILASFFTYMAVDDGAKLHERFGSTIRRVLQGEGGEGNSTNIGGKAFEIFPSYSWQITFLPVFVALGCFTLWFLWTELNQRRMRFVVVAALGCFVTAVFMDFIEGLEPDHPLNFYTHINRSLDLDDWAIVRFRNSGYDTLRHFSKTVEESLEMFGNSLMWFVFVTNLGRVATELRVRFSPLK